MLLSHRSSESFDIAVTGIPARLIDAQYAVSTDQPLIEPNHKGPSAPFTSILSSAKHSSLFPSYELTRMTALLMAATMAFGMLR